MDIEIIAVVVFLVIGVLFFGALFTVIRTLARIVWIAYMLITYPIRFVVRLF